MPDQPEKLAEDRRTQVARAIYAKLDADNLDPWDVAIARQARYQAAHSPMVRQAFAYADAAIAVLEADFALVSRVPTRGLLISMAMRMDHAFGMPPDPTGLLVGMKTPAEKEAVLVDMGRLHEEVVGTGFYNPSREAWYRGMVPVHVSPGIPDHAAVFVDGAGKVVGGIKNIGTEPEGDA